MATWITRLEAPASQARGTRVAVKDAIDVAGVPTTVGCRAIADSAEPAVTSADCLAGLDAAGARVVGKTNLHELCFGTTGLNPVFGNPVNPRWPDRVPGGSSSGSAVAVASDEADVGIGTDTGGSVRLPAACCGIVGLKTTYGRVSLTGVWPLSPSLDTVGPLARDVAGVVRGMELLEPGFSVTGSAAATVIGRVRPRHIRVDPALDAAADGALRAAGFEVVDVELPDWEAADPAFVAIIGAEAWASDNHLLAVPNGVAEPVASRLASGAAVTAVALAAAKRQQAQWAATVAAAFSRVEVLALPTLVERPAPVTEPVVPNVLCHPFNLAGVPALSLPVGGGAGESLQLVGPAGSEALLCVTAALVERSLL
ncbi:MAG TPA: amidase [Acidimicrobiales bacterium]|nr:amidase [Acidimicrobiales bacterium]